MTVVRSEAPADLPPIARLFNAVLVLLLLLVGVSFLYPQGAFPIHSLSIAAGLVLVAGVSGGLLPGVASSIAPAMLLSLAAAAGIPLWLALLLNWAPVPALGRASVAIWSEFALAYAAAALLVAAWPRNLRSAEHRLIPERAIAQFLAIGIALLCVHATYQVLGPASMPGTFRRMEADQLALAAEGIAVPEGVLNALRERRATGTFGAANVFGSVATVGTILCLGFALSAHGRKRALWLSGAAVGAASVYLTGSRGATLACFAGIATFVILRLVAARKTAGAGAAFAALLMFLLSAGPTRAQQPNAEAKSRWFGSTTIQQRAYYVETGLHIWKENWIAGIGPGAYAARYHRHRIPGAGETQFAHNWFVQLGVEGGIVALTFAFLAFGIPLVDAGKRFLHGESDPVLLAVTAATGAMLLHGLVDYTLSTYEGALLLALLLASLHRAPHPPPARAGEVSALVAIPAAIGAGLLLWYVHVRPALSEYESIAARYSWEDRAEPIETLRHWDRAIEWQYDNPRMWEARGRFLMAHRHEEATNSLRVAASLAPESASIQEALAYSTMQDGDTSASLSHALHATALHPLDGMHWMSLAEIAAQAGDPQLARSALERANRTRLFNSEEVQRLARLNERMKSYFDTIGP